MVFWLRSMGQILAKEFCGIFHAIAWFFPQRNINFVSTRGWATRDDVLNIKPVEGLLKYFQQ